MSQINTKLIKCVTAVICLVLIIVGLWSIDITTSAMLIGEAATISTGFFEGSPIQIYHLAMYQIIAASLILVIMVLWNSVKW